MCDFRAAMPDQLGRRIPTQDWSAKLQRLVIYIVAAMAIVPLIGCESSGSAKRNLDVVYRFENLRKSPTVDEWAAIKAVLDRSSVRTVDARPTGTRTIGTLQLLTYEARVVLPSVRDLEKVQVELEALAQRSGSSTGRVEVFLTQVRADYRTNFVAATSATTISGIAPRGHRVRLFVAPGTPPIEASVSSSGVWRAELPVVPPDGWVYGVSEDPLSAVPPRYFRVNVASKAQERVDEAEFLRLFPPGAVESTTKRAEQAPARSDADERRLEDQRRKEEDALRRRREREDRSRRPDK